LGTGSFWGHEDRIRTSSLDLGCQAAPLRLLLKDHKPWNPDSGKEIPSRPVVNAKAGYNCHLSEILSIILGPVAKEAAGFELNSTGDLLAKVNDINGKIVSNSSVDSIEFQTKSPVSDSQHDRSILEDDCRFTKQTQQSVSLCSAESFVNSDDVWCNHCQKCNRTAPTMNEVNQAKDLIKKVTNKKVNSAMHVTHNLRSKLKASRAATKLYHRCCLKSPQDPANVSPERSFPAIPDPRNSSKEVRQFEVEYKSGGSSREDLVLCHILSAILHVLEMSKIVR